MNFKTGIILPLKESFSNIGFGAVSVWVNDYIKYSGFKDNIIFCKKLSKKFKYLNPNVNPILVNTKIYSNLSYIKKISNEIFRKKITLVEIHNRPEYAHYLIKNHPELKVNLIFHNDPNTIRLSKKIDHKKFLLQKCNKIIFVSNWVKSRFFINLNAKHQNNVEVVYNFIKPINKFPRKEKIIIFSGKLNKSKGFDIFGNSIIKILNKYKNWKAEVYGNEQREIFNFNHERLKINNWIDHNKILKKYEKASISVVNPTWQEPFGRTALESASRGCAVITSKSGGLNETFNNNLILKKNNVKELTKLISKLIENKSDLLKVQKNNFYNVIHTPKKSVSKLDHFRQQNFSTPYKKKNFLKILHVGNFGSKVDHRLFNISIASKLSNGLIRNGHDVINFDYRDIISRLFEKNNIDNKLLSIANNYRPDLILLGHNNILNRTTLMLLKEKLKCKIAIWYEDHVMKNDPNYKNNLNLLEKNHDLIDQYFITTAPEIIKTKIKKNKLNYLPIPVDPNIEDGEFYKYNKTKDLFFAISHGVNYGKLKNNKIDSRINFIEKLIKNSFGSIDFHFFGLYGEEPIWNYNFNKELMISKTALNLSRGGPNKYASSNRIASLMGNGILPFIHEKIKYQDFFDNDEIITYKDSADLISQLSQIKNQPLHIIKRSKNAKKRYHDIFNNKIIADFIIYKIFNTNKKFNYIWKY